MAAMPVAREMKEDDSFKRHPMQNAGLDAGMMEGKTVKGGRRSFVTSRSL
jgi:hypothetical protein